MTEMAMALAHDGGISVPEMLALSHIADDEGMGPGDLARRLQMTSGAVTALVDRLEDAGLVERQRHPRDRRRVVLRRTPLAAERLAEEAAELAAEIVVLGESFGEEERVAIGRFLEGLVAIIEDRVAGACGPALPQAPPKPRVP
jgi:DNA-binding MarR family transcriptional regulator